MRTSFVGPGDGEFGAFQPGAGSPLRNDDLEAYRFLHSVVEGEPYGATLIDAVRSAGRDEPIGDLRRAGLAQPGLRWSVARDRQL